jgi:hypothetical protein
MKRYTAVLLSLCMAFLCLAGCSSPEIHSYSKEGTSATEKRDMSAAYAAYDPTAVVMTINGTQVTWEEYFYWLNSCITALDSDNGGLIENWNSAYSRSEKGESYAQYAMSSVEKAIVQYVVMDAKAKELGVELTDADKTKIASTLKSDMTKYCGDSATEDDFAAYLKTIYMTRDYYDFVNKIALLYYDTFDKMFGTNGEKCSDEDTMTFAKENDYMTADYIFISATGDDGTALTGDALTAKETLANKLASQLQGITDKTQLKAKFTELRNANTADPNAKNYPNGYCFMASQTDSSMAAACEKLSEYQVSDPVKTSSGYYIVMRLPMTPSDEVTYVSEGVYRTLRYYAAVGQYDSLVGSWIDEATVQYQGDFAKLDIAALLKK